MHIHRLARTGWLVLAPLLLGGVPAWADGTLTHLSGAVSVQTVDGRTLPGAAGTKVGVGDTVVTGTRSFARMEMTDGGEMVLRPESRLQLEGYTFDKEKQGEDSMVLRMLKGGMRTVTGLIGKRGNRDAYSLKTVTATIGIRGTQFDVRVCEANCGSMASGTYVAVRFGAVLTTNPQGSLAVTAGQAAYVPPATAPVILPRDPGIGFTAPAVIPKLDEKKKQAAAATAAETAKPPAGGGAAPASGSGASTVKPPAGGTGGGQQGSPSSSSASPTSTSTATGGDSGGQGGQGGQGLSGSPFPPARKRRRT